MDKHIWKVIGAHDFNHVDTHGGNRFERWHYGADPAVVKEALTLIWPQLREQASQAGLGSVWHVCLQLAGSAYRHHALHVTRDYVE